MATGLVGALMVGAGVAEAGVATGLTGALAGTGLLAPAVAVAEAKACAMAAPAAGLICRHAHFRVLQAFACAANRPPCYRQTGKG